MPKSTATYWNTLSASNHSKWAPIKGMETMAEELTLSIAPETGEYTRLTRFFAGAEPPRSATNLTLTLKRYSS